MRRIDQNTPQAKPEDSSRSPCPNSGTPKRRRGKLAFDPCTQGYPGQPHPAEEAPDEIDVLCSDPPVQSEPWFSREPSWHGKDAKRCREYLEGLSDKEIVDEYYRLRDQKVVWGGGYFYPNMRRLFLTPFEREKDRREVALWQEKYGESEVARWYEEAKEKPCVWWLDNHLVAKHSFKSCMGCGTCVAGCPAAEFLDFNPREVMDTIQSRNEDEIVALLKAETIWYCGQCGACKLRCPRGNNPFGMISSLRQLSQLKGYHTCSARGRQQYTARHLWGGNFWNRGCSLYFRNTLPRFHLDFGPRFVRYVLTQEEMYRRIGGCPDMDGSMPGKKIHPDTLNEIRRCWQVGGTLVLWNQIEKCAQNQAEERNMDIDDYFYLV